jgi:hypothetical protein
MKLPSFRQVFHDAGVTLRRFPLVILDAVVTTCAAIILIDYEGPAGPTVLFQILLAGVLGIPFLMTLALVAEKKRLRTNTSRLLQLLGVVILAGFALTVPPDLTHAPTVTVFQFFILGFALVFLAAVAPFITRGEINGFWQYNKALFLRLLMAFLYGVVLYVGLSIALAALDNLFGVNVPGKRYAELWVFTHGVFTIWFFLAGIPDDLVLLDGLTDYARGLKVFAQYILFPIVAIYFVILYAYLGKILIAWNWPQGWVSKLILGFSGTGVFLFFLLHPIIDRPENSWMKKSARWFYLLLLPLVVMLFLAVWRRVSEYGITEGRYLALAMGLWIAFLFINFSFGKRKNIKVIPLSLCILAFLVSFGPWGAFSVARRSQIGRLEQLTTQAGILVDGKIRVAHNEVPLKETKQISSILSYLHEMHGYDAIQPWFSQSLKVDSAAGGVQYKGPEAVARLMGLEYASRWAESAEASLALEPAGSFPIEKYERLAQLNLYSGMAEKVNVLTDSITCRLVGGMDTLVISDMRTGDEMLRLNLRQHADMLMTKYAMTANGRVFPDSLAITAEGKSLRVRLCPWHIYLQRREGVTKVSSLNGVLLYTMVRDR